MKERILSVISQLEKYLGWTDDDELNKVLDKAHELFKDLLKFYNYYNEIMVVLRSIMVKLFKSTVDSVQLYEDINKLSELISSKVIEGAKDASSSTKI